MREQLPVLVVLIPLLGAPLCLLLRTAALSWALFGLAAAGSLTCAVFLTVQVRDTGTVHYEMGGWPAPEGIEFVVAEFNTPVLLIVSAIATVGALYSRTSARVEIEPARVPLFYACLCLTLAGLLGVTITGDAFNAFVFLEISSLSTYALIAMGRRRRALLASFRYLMVGTVGATFLLIGIGLVYALTGTLNMADLRDRLGEIEGNRALYAAVVFVFVGLAIKMAAFPLHAWLPGAYAEAPSAVAVVLSATSTKVAIYLFARFAFTVFGVGLVFQTMSIHRIGLVLACLAMLIGSAVACFQNDLKYVLAWSSVAQIGYIVAGISLATAEGVSAGYLHMINHAALKAAMFAAAGLLLLRLGSVQLSALAGLGRRMPLTFAALVLAGIGLIGVPPSAGFASKWALAGALIEEDQWVVLAALLVSSLLALVYVGRIVEAAWFAAPQPAQPAQTAASAVPAGSQPPAHQPPGFETPAGEPPAVEPADAQPGSNSQRTPFAMAAAMWLLVGVSLWFGIDPSLPGELADSAAALLLANGGG